MGAVKELFSMLCDDDGSLIDFKTATEATMFELNVTKKKAKRILKSLGYWDYLKYN